MNISLRCLLGVGVVVLTGFLHAADNSPPKVGLKLVAEGFTSPLNLIPLDDGSGRLIVADQMGIVRLLTKEGGKVEDLFLDLRPKMVKVGPGFDERGLLGIVLHPRFRENRRLFIYYSAPRRESLSTNWNHTSHLSEFQVVPDFSRVDPASERLFLQIDQPQMNHNCGRLAFGPDGFLYVGVGDGGEGNDVGFGHSEQGNGQDLTTLLGKILRLDVNGKAPYAVPSDNPFVGHPKARPEIYSLGWRNPWGISFDRGGTHELFASEVGQNAFEEVNIVVKGGNYGWRLREGFHGFDPKSPNTAPSNAPRTSVEGAPLLDPILEYKNFRAFPKDPQARGISITGGYVYRGQVLPHLQGKYIFADWSRNWALPDGVIFAATRPADGGKVWSMEALALAAPTSGKVGAYILAFGQDADGELYILTNGSNAPNGTRGKVFKLVPM